MDSTGASISLLLILEEHSWSSCMKWSPGPPGMTSLPTFQILSQVNLEEKVTVLCLGQGSRMHSRFEGTVIRPFLFLRTQLFWRFC